LDQVSLEVAILHFATPLMAPQKATQKIQMCSRCMGAWRCYNNRSWFI